MRLTSIVRRAHEVVKKQTLVPFPSAAGGASYEENSIKVIRFARHGCTNRPFYHIVVQEAHEVQHGDVIEQLGSYDPLPNMYNEKLVAFNFVRIQHWLDKGALVSISVKRLLGLCGYFPIHPRSFNDAWCRRKMLMESLAELEAAASSTASTAKASESVESSKESTPES